jgi:hypothetical protein
MLLVLVICASHGSPIEELEMLTKLIRRSDFGHTLPFGVVDVGDGDRPSG